MKKMKTAKPEDPKAIAGIPERYKAKQIQRQRDSDPTLMVMSVVGGVGMGVMGLVFTGQI